MFLLFIEIVELNSTYMYYMRLLYSLRYTLLDFLFHKTSGAEEGVSANGEITPTRSTPRHGTNAIHVAAGSFLIVLALSTFSCSDRLSLLRLRSTSDFWFSIICCRGWALIWSTGDNGCNATVKSIARSIVGGDMYCCSIRGDSPGEMGRVGDHTQPVRSAVELFIVE